MATLTTNINYLQPTSFKLVIDRKNYPNLEFFCQTFTHPAMIMSAAEVPFRKVTNVPFPGDKLTFNELSANIILDEDMNGYTEMYNWMRRLLDTELTSVIDAQFPIYSDITLHILSSHNNTTKKIRYIDCIPTTIGDIEFQSTADGGQYIAFNTSFRFSYFELV